MINTYGQQPKLREHNCLFVCDFFPPFYHPEIFVHILNIYLNFTCGDLILKWENMNIQRYGELDIQSIIVLFAQNFGYLYVWCKCNF